MCVKERLGVGGGGGQRRDGQTEKGRNRNETYWGAGGWGGVGGGESF